MSNSNAGEVLEEVKRLLNSYILTLQVKRSVLDKIYRLEKSKRKRSRERHAISGLRSSMRYLESREETLLRTIEAKIALVIGTIEIDSSLRVAPCIHAASNAPCYRVDKITDTDIVKISSIFRNEDLDLARAGFVRDYPKILVEFPKLSGDVEFIVYALNMVISKLGIFKLPLHIIIRKIITKDLSLVKEVIRRYFEADSTIEIFVPGDLTFYLSEDFVRA